MTHAVMPLSNRHALLVVGGLGTPRSYFQPLVDALPPAVDFYFHEFDVACDGRRDHALQAAEFAQVLALMYGRRNVTVMCFSISCYSVAHALRDHHPHLSGVHVVLVDPPPTTYDHNPNLRALLDLPAWAQRAWDACQPWCLRPWRQLALRARDLLSNKHTPWCVDWVFAQHPYQELRAFVKKHLEPYNNHLPVTPNTLVLVASQSPYYTSRSNHTSAGHLVIDVPGAHHVLFHDPARITSLLAKHASWPVKQHASLQQSSWQQISQQGGGAPQESESVVVQMPHGA